MTTQNTTTVEIRDNAYWPDEVRLASFSEQDVQAEKDDRVRQADRMIVNDSEYATLYFVS